ncbi:LacI family DNA-binding transcriptional regulator [Deinococcus cellulosilyticus]|uniref:Transcriptional regulator n=1 Tax=Deinococcus cellulosilyticus (strain DSM 18568 / NBRC 106333 / KACC 11606 / 5516J-15) TaxID=1223518 RepID=A0A511N6X0_DEIC1|nr:LacI family DNA-binding transcriptional regulator [Deinococcus cellulosilyticus]GEM48603.1 transcriptional regulator [Deinococcus cellulosilyticus NBRC 106333 = KACC 11606]
MTLLPTDSAPVTLDDVARHAGVSPMTVSNVINGKTNVRPATREKVLESIKATGYRANPMARALAGGRSRMISVFTPQLNKPYASEVVQGAARAAEALNYDLVVMMLVESGTSDLSMMTRLSTGALLIQPSRDGRWKHTDLPAHVVSVDGPGDRPLTVDNYGGACQAMQHLISLGHTRIGFISGLADEGRRPEGPFVPGLHDRNDADERYRGYLESMAAAGLQIPQGYIQHGNYTKVSGEQATQRLLTLPEPPTALFVSGDAMALGAIHMAQDLGMEVPRDLSVVGFDDLPIAAASRPGLTTVRQPLQQMGEVAVQMLVSLAEGQNPEVPGPFPTELIQRESTTSPRDRS